MSRRLCALWVIVGVLGVMAACRSDGPIGAVSDEFRFLEADVVIIGGNHTFTNAEGIREGHLVFDTAYQWQDSVNTALRGVDWVVYHEDGSERARVTGERGLLDSRGERFTVQGNVVLVVPGEQRRLESGELLYDPYAGRIWSDSSFMMIHGNRTFRGSSFTSDLEFRNFEARGTGG